MIHNMVGSFYDIQDSHYEKNNTSISK